MNAATDCVVRTRVGEVPIDSVTAPGLWTDGDAIKQVEAVARLDGVRRVVAMPDLHPGRGYPIGTATLTQGVVIPALLDKDLGCGMSFLLHDKSRIRPDQVRKRAEKRFFRWGGFEIDNLDFLAALSDPAKSIDLFQEAPGFDADWLRSFLDAAYLVQPTDHSTLQDLLDDDLLRRARDSFATLGGGNHFLEVQEVAEIISSEEAARFGIESEQIALMVHTGSRSFGYSLAESLLADAELSDKILPLAGSQAARYREALALATNYALLNRAFLIMRAMDIFGLALPRPILDVPHNFAEFRPNGEVLHRKGAAAALIRNGRPGPAIIPGAFGRNSWFGVSGAGNSDLLDSLNHGLGRKWSRTVAAEKMARKATEKGMASITSRVAHLVSDKKTLMEETPDAYKNPEQVLAAASGARLFQPIAVLKPLFIIKE